MTVPTFSVIVCTYNPHPQFFERLLRKLDNLETKGGFLFEIIIIDNNSTVPLDKQESVKRFLSGGQQRQLFIEKTPGLTNARIRGIAESKYDWCVFFDDDNEPDEKYLSALAEVVVLHPEVGCWGAGVINVEYEVAVPNGPFAQEQAQLFQQRNIKQKMIGNGVGGEFYPPGTGIVIKKSLLEEYVNNVRFGKYSMSDRKGKSLSSAGDAQMIYTIVKQGYSVGVSPAMKITHMISAKKLSLKYMVRLVYGLDSSHVKAFNEVFTEDPYPTSPVGDKDVWLRVRGSLSKFVKSPASIKSNLLYLSRNMGMLQAQIIAGNYQQPYLLRCWEKLIGLK